MKVLIVIPAYNEEKAILKTVSNIWKYNETAEQKYDIIVINDGSKDNTAKICKEHSIPHISAIHNLGIGGAVQTGYKYAHENDYDIAVQFDGDGQHDVNYVKNIITPIINKEADFVIGSRFVEGSMSEFKSSAARRVGINIISFFIKLISGKKVHDTTSGFRAINKRIISDFANSYPTEYPEPITTTELLVHGYKLKEIPVAMHERDGGISSIRAWKNAYYMINVILMIIMVGIRGNKNAK